MRTLPPLTLWCELVHADLINIVGGVHVVAARKGGQLGGGGSSNSSRYRWAAMKTSVNTLVEWWIMFLCSDHMMGCRPDAPPCSPAEGQLTNTPSIPRFEKHPP